MIYKIAILGDFNPAYATHHALNDSTRSMKKLFPEELQFDWIGTDIANAAMLFGKKTYCALWIAPGSPYKNMQNVFDIITYTRMNKVPTFGNCGGFQHMIIEYAKNKCGIAHADHEEINPDAIEPVISKLSCSLVEKKETLTVTDKTSLLYNIIQSETVTGGYFCSYGLNEKYAVVLQQNGMLFTAISTEGHTRAFELRDHPFFLGTLFQPALTSSDKEPNPLIVEFIHQGILFSSKNVMKQVTG